MQPFSDLADFVAVPRVTDLRLSPDGSRLIAVVSSLSTDRKRFASALWDLDPTGKRPPARLTRSDKGEDRPAFLPDGRALFISAREPDKDEDDVAALWLLPAGGGEARRVAALPGGVTAVAAAADAGTVVLTGPVLPGQTDEERRTARKDAGVTAILFEQSPVRFWDRDLGPGQLRLFVADLADDGLAELRDLTPEPGRALDEQSFVLTPDGRTVVTGWSTGEEPGYPRSSVVAIDVASGQQRLLAGDATSFYVDPVVSPDGSHVVAVQVLDGGYDDPPDRTLWLLDLATGQGRDLTPQLDAWPGGAVWSHDSASVYFTADEDGRAPVFRESLHDGAITRLAADGHYEALCVASDGSAVYALRSRIDAPATPVRLDPLGVDQAGVPLPAPGAVEVPGRVEDVETRTADGQRVRSWLVVPEGEGPHPLVLWVHGGPLGSWNAWSWRWNPWMLAARGYAVLMPDPALSTGYGLDFVRRGWGQWGGTPYDDLMAATDGVLARPDIDASRTAVMGGSYGGYLTNWIVGHTDRFRCAVTHASLWALDQFQGTTDAPGYWRREFGLPDEQPERYDTWSPHHHADAITTPMLVIHGDKDYRVPIGEGLRLWWDLQRHGVESKFLYFSDENHWVLKPGNAMVWYDTVFAWLACHLEGAQWRPPPLL